MNKVKSNLTPILLNDLIFTVSNNGYFYVIDKQQGNILRVNYLYKNYKIKKRKYLSPTGFSVSQNKLFVSNDNGRLITLKLLIVGLKFFESMNDPQRNL